MQEATSGIIDQMPLNNGFSTSYMVVPASSSFKDISLTLASKSGSDLPGYLSQFTSLVPASDNVNMTTTLMTISISVIERIEI